MYCLIALPTSSLTCNAQNTTVAREGRQSFRCSKNFPFMETDYSLQSSQFPATHLHTKHKQKCTSITFEKIHLKTSLPQISNFFQVISSLQISKLKFCIFLCISYFVPRQTRNAKIEGRQLDTGSAQYCRSSCCHYG